MLKRLREIKKRLEAITPGPWAMGDEANQEIEINAHKGEKRLGLAEWDGLVSVYGSFDSPDEGTEVMRANAEFIAHAPADVQYLLAKVEKLMEWVNNAKKEEEK